MLSSFCRGWRVQASGSDVSRLANLAFSCLSGGGGLTFIPLIKHNGAWYFSFLKACCDPHPVHRRLTSASLSLLTPRTKSPSAWTLQPLGGLYFSSYNRQLAAAGATDTAIQAGQGNVIAGAANDQFTAYRAIGIIGLRIGHITQINIMQMLPGHIPGATHSFQGSRRRLKAVPGEIAGEMEGCIHPQVGCHPLDQFFQFSRFVVEAGNQEGGYLHMAAGVHCCCRRLKHRAVIALDNLTIKFQAEALDINIPGVNPGQEFLQGLRPDKAVGDHDVLQPGIPGQLRRGQDEFKPDQGFGVGVGYSQAVDLPCFADQVIGRNDNRLGLLLGYFPVLAEVTAEVAAHGAG
ncbi:acyl-CoA dehydrogenases [Moorella thermoacetica Y72]|uniref:Acyl-CoA dehydrogenases n=1 Tax=Moorella thermoacetica Y72 TaxID=1325331 RepID=A0A0S6UC66_NEOTH|nr:acyl-CoA dehydrogenases [Moorella thermoacetica Y72]